MSAKKNRCFVISPIGAPGSEVRTHADDVFDYIIKPVATQMGYETERGDHVSRPGRISDQMYDRIFMTICSWRCLPSRTRTSITSLPSPMPPRAR
ncbi:MAG: hypothetical protein ABWY38_01335 [Methyloceanibacter sp.]